MSAIVLADPASIVNYSLAKIGYRLRIGSLYDGTIASKKALDVYSQTRDVMLRLGDWNFAMKTAAAIASGGSVPAPWTNSWTYPADCLRVRNVYDTGSVADTNNPLPTLWQEADDPTKGKVIYTRAANATIVYNAQITDPSQWESLFLDAFALALGRNLRSLVDGDANMTKLSDEEISAETRLANEVVG